MVLDASEPFRRRAKALMRKRFRSHRGGLPSRAAAQRSARIVERLLVLEAVVEATSVASFWPMLGRKEVDLRAAHEVWRGAGKAVLYPRIHDEGPMTWHAIEREEDFEEHPMGFMQPTTAEAPAPGLIVVPGIAFDPRGHRIGYGGGFYDRTLAAHPDVPTVGVAYHFQLAGDLPDTPGDVPVDAIVTDQDVLKTPGR